MKSITHLPIATVLFFFASSCNNNYKPRSMENKLNGELTKTSTTISKDGTAIAFEKTGAGPSLILVNGALAHRNLYGESDLAALLGKSFTVIFYDRRGRGESTDTKPYGVEKEIEDIASLVNEAGGSVYLYGSSGGAALALLAAEKLGPKKIKKLVLCEPPYESNTKQEFVSEKNKVNELVKAGKSDEAVTFFMQKRGMPPDKIRSMKKSAEWDGMVRIAHTLIYDFEILGDGTVPVDVAKNIAIPTLIMYGEESFDFMPAAADKVRKIIPGAVAKILKNQTHDVSPESAAQVLLEFFGM